MPKHEGELRRRPAQFRDTANRARRFEQSVIVNALAVELLVKADVIEHLTDLIPSD